MKVLFYLKYLLLAVCLLSGVISTLYGDLRILLATFALCFASYIYWDFMDDKIDKWEGKK